MNGGSALTGYYLQRNSGYGTMFIQPGVFIPIGTLAYTYTNLVEGATYKFRIAAVNTIYTTNSFDGDVLNFSDATSQMIANVPGAITTLSQ